MTTLVCRTEICTYPSAIARACAALDESPVFRDLPDGYFRVVVRLIKKINLSRLFSPIVASRGTIAKESGKSIETVGRAVKWLEDHELVTREQRARAGLRGSSAPLVPTQKLIDALTLSQPPSQQQKARDHSTSPTGDLDMREDQTATCICQQENVEMNREFFKQAHSAQLGCDTKHAGVGAPSCPQITVELHVTADASISTVQGLQQSYQRQPKIPGEHSKTVKVGKFRIPEDLAWLIQNQNLSPTGLLALMTQAKNMGQRLSDIVELTRSYLVKLSGRRLYAYISTLVRQGKDYRYIRAHQEDENRMKQDAARDAERLAIKEVDWVGRRFSTIDRTGVITVEPGGWLRVGKPRSCGQLVFGTRRMDVEFVRLVERQSLQALA